MKFLTIEEYETTKVYALDNYFYNRIYDAFAKACGDRIAARLMARFSNKTVRELSMNSYVDILSMITII